MENNVKTFSISFTDSELQVLSNALIELPFKSVAPLINKINEQLQAQIVKEQAPEHVQAQADLI